MQTIKCYLYANLIEVQFWDSTIFSVRERIVYSRPVKVYQGIDNPLQVIVRNQEQKPINLTGYLLQLDIQDPQSSGSLQSFAVNITNYLKGQGSVTIPKDIVNALEQRFYKLTVKLIEDATNKERPAYIDDNYGALIDLEVLPGWYESTPLTLEGDEVIDAGTI